MPRVNRSADDQQLVDASGPEFLEVLARGLKLIGLFNAERRQMTMSEVAERAGLSRATARRVLHTLQALGFVVTEGRQYQLTPQVLTLAAAYLTSNLVPAVMKPIVERLAKTVEEACAVAVLDRGEVVMVARASPVRILTVGLEIGYRIPAYCSALGRVLLGGLPDADLDAYLHALTPEPLTRHTRIDKAEIRAAVEAARRDGYSLVDEETEYGFRSIAVPVRQADGRVAAALHVGVHLERASRAHMLETFLPLLRAEAAAAAPLLL